MRGPFMAKEARRIVCILQGAEAETGGTVHSLPLRGCHMAEMAE